MCFPSTGRYALNSKCELKNLFLQFNPLFNTNISLVFILPLFVDKSPHFHLFSFQKILAPYLELMPSHLEGHSLMKPKGPYRLQKSGTGFSKAPKAFTTELCQETVCRFVMKMIVDKGQSCSNSDRTGN